MKTKRNIYLMYGIALLQGMVFYGPVATLYRQAAGVSIFQITLIESISLALCIALEMPWGMAADRIGYKNTMIFCCILYGISKVVFWRASGFGGFLAERLMLSVVMAGMSGCDAGMLYLSCRKGESHRVFSIYNMMGTSGLLLASLVYSLWIGSDYRLAGLLTVVSYGLAALLSLGLVEVKEERSKRREMPGLLGQLRLVAKDRSFLVLLIGMALLSETNQTVTVFLSQLQYVRCGISPSVMGYLYILMTLSGMIQAWSVKFSKKMGEMRFGLSMFAAAALACGGLAVTGNAVLSVALVLLLRMASSLFYPFQMELQNRHVKSADRATVLSIYAVIMEGTGTATNLLFGKAAELHLPFAMACGMVLCLAGGAAYAASLHFTRSGNDAAGLQFTRSGR